jgi:hypothetical protein
LRDEQHSRVVWASARRGELVDEAHQAREAREGHTKSATISIDGLSAVVNRSARREADPVRARRRQPDDSRQGRVGSTPGALKLGPDLGRAELDGEMPSLVLDHALSIRYAREIYERVFQTEEGAA